MNKMFNYKKIIVAGCSFTYNNEMTWAGKLAEHTDVVNVAQRRKTYGHEIKASSHAHLKMLKLKVTWRK